MKMDATNILVMKLKEGKSLNNVYSNEDYIFFIDTLTSVSNPKDSVETIIPFELSTINYKILSVDKNKAFIRKPDGTNDWYYFIADEGKNTLYLSDLKNNKVNYINEEGHFDIVLDNKDIINNFDVVDITI